MRDGAMDCIVWASRVARTPEDELPPPVPGSATKQNELDEEEKDRIKTMNLEESESDQEASVEEGQLVVGEDDDVSEGEDNQVNSDAESTCSDGLESTLEKISELRDQQPCNSLRQRQLGLIEAGVKRATKERENEAQRAKERILAETKQRWISLGMLREEDAHLLETVEGPYHPRIERSREEYFSKKKEEEQKNLQDTASKYYDNEWVWEKEKELRQLQEREEIARDVDVKRAVKYMIGVTVEALKLNFKRDDLPGLSRLVIVERKKRAMDMKWISREQAECVTSVWAPMPYPFDGEECECDDEEIFITPSSSSSSQPPTPKSTSQNVFQRGKSKKRSSQTSTPVPKKGRITNFFQPSQQ